MSRPKLIRLLIAGAFAAFMLPSIANESSGQEKVASLTVVEKIEGLSTLWMELRRNFPYRDRLPALDEKFRESIPKVIDEISLADYYRILQEFLSVAQDGHTFIVLPKGLPITRPRLPIGVTRFGQEAVVTWIRSDLASQIPLGSRIESVDGRPLASMVEKSIIAVAASTPHVALDLAYRNCLEGPAGTSADVMVARPDHTNASVTLVRGAPWPPGVGVVSAEKEDPPTFETANFGGDVQYVALRSFADWDVYNKFKASIPSLLAAKYVVLDLRDNSGGNGEIGYSLLSHFSPQAIPTPASKRFIYDPHERALAPRTREYDTQYRSDNGIQPAPFPQEFIQPSDKAEQLQAKLVILINHGTLSAAEDTVAAAMALHPLIVGEQSGGSTGQPIYIALPRNGGAFIVSKADFYPNSDISFVGHGIAPDVYIETTPEKLILGHDEALEYIKSAIYTGQLDREILKKSSSEK